jgi:hypothetical protein
MAGQLHSSISMRRRRVHARLTPDMLPGFGAPNYSADEQLRRLQLFANGYGPGPTIAELLDAMVERQRIVMAEEERFGKAGMGEWAATCHRWTLLHLRPGKRWS